MLGPLASGARADVAGDRDVPVASPAFELRIQLDPLSRPTGEPALSGMRVIRSGTAIGPLLSGDVQSGHVRWQTDAGRAAVDVHVQIMIRREDGSVVEVLDRSVHPAAARPADLARLATATELVVAGEQDGLPMLFVGRMDASLLAAGSLTLSTFRIG